MPQGRDLSLEAGGGTEKEKEKEEEKFLLCESIGHRPLRNRFPKSKVIFQFQKHPGRFLEKIQW